MDKLANHLLSAPATRLLSAVGENHVSADSPLHIVSILSQLSPPKCSALLLCIPNQQFLSDLSSYFNSSPLFLSLWPHLSFLIRWPHDQLNLFQSPAPNKEIHVFISILLSSLFSKKSVLPPVKGQFNYLFSKIHLLTTMLCLFSFTSCVSNNLLPLASSPQHMDEHAHSFLGLGAHPCESYWPALLP